MASSDKQGGPQNATGGNDIQRPTLAKGTKLITIPVVDVVPTDSKHKASLSRYNAKPR